VRGLVLIVVAGFVLAPDPAPAAPASGGAPWYMEPVSARRWYSCCSPTGLERRAYISAEVRDRKRNMVRALLLSIGIVTLLYVLVNLAT